MVTRRRFLLTAAAASVTIPVVAFAQGGASKLSAKQRVDRALKGAEVDRPPYSFWHHFGLEKQPSSAHAKATLEFYRKFKPDVVKVMSDYAYPKAASGEWYALREEKNPFPEQIKALNEIREGLGGQAYFVETIFNPWNVAEKLSSKEEVLRLKQEKPQQLLDALEAIAKSQANHARLAVQAGASGIFLAIANAQDGILSPADYAKFSEPFDKIVLSTVRTAPLNILHLHGDKVYLDRFYQNWPAAGINYSVHGTGVSFADARRKYAGVLMGGIDERNYRKLSADELKQQSSAAAKEAGRKFILAPGCSVPDESTDTELQKLPQYLKA